MKIAINDANVLIDLVRIGLLDDLGFCPPMGGRGSKLTWGHE